MTLACYGTLEIVGVIIIIYNIQTPAVVDIDTIKFCSIFEILILGPPYLFPMTVIWY